MNKSARNIQPGDVIHDHYQGWSRVVSIERQFFGVIVHTESGRRIRFENTALVSVQDGPGGGGLVIEAECYALQPAVWPDDPSRIEAAE